MKLSKTQSEALNVLYDNRDEWECAYRLRLNLNTLRALRNKNLVKMRDGLGSMAFPHTSIKWRITPEGISKFYDHT